MLKTTFILLALQILVFLPSICQESLFSLMINTGTSWTFAYLAPWFFTFFIAVLISRLVFQNLTGFKRTIFAIFALLIPVVTYFGINPIYEGDFIKKGRSTEFTKNQILNDILSEDPNFDGLVCVASPNCPHCVEAVKTKMAPMHKRNQSKVFIYLAFGDQSTVENFKKQSESGQTPLIVNSDIYGALDIDETVIPVFLYIKNGQIVHLWRNDQMGYPALDWIESKLN